MPEEKKERIKPVIEEVVEEPQESKEEKVEKVAPEPTETKLAEEPKKMNLKLIVAITLVSSLVAAFVSGGVYVYLSGIDKVSKEAVATPSPTPSASPEATATPEPVPVDLSRYSVRVLNGSGAIGAARVGKEILVKAGFSVGSTGNASNYNLKNTVIQAKPGVPAEALDKAKKALEAAKYKVELGEALAASSDYDIVVTIGRN